MKKPFLYQIITILGFTLFCHSCAPVFSELQSARTVGKDKVEVTPSFSSVSTGDDEREGIQNHLGVQVAYGISEKLDVRLRYEYIWGKEDVSYEGGNVSVLGIGPKYSLLKNKIAVALPMGRAFGGGFDNSSWQIHPTVLLTLPAIEDKLDISLSPKYLIAFCEDCDSLLAFNLGLAFSSDLSKWSIRPEYGISFDPGSSGYFAHFSLAVSTVLGKE